MDDREQLVHSSACVLSIGDELSRGQMLDTNSKAIAQRLSDLGVDVVEHVTVGDSMVSIRDAIQRLAMVAPLVIVTGGLGPTQDDLTRLGLAAVLGETLVEDPEALNTLDARLRSRGRVMTDAQRTQSLRPESAKCLRNDFGTAPGLLARVRGSLGVSLSSGAEATSQRHADCDVFCLPGPPGEWKPMFDQHIVPRITLPKGHMFVTRLLHMYGLAESEAASMIPGLMDRNRNPLVGITASGGVLTWRIRAITQSKSEGMVNDIEIEQTIALIRERMGRYVFGEGADTLASVAVRTLAARGQSVCVVESCTGGMLGERLTEVAGASAAFAGGWITYSNELKHKLVGVDLRTIARHGAVSRETATEMAMGGMERSGATRAIAITGIAGPDGGSPDKPVGTVWIAVASRTDSALASDHDRSEPSVIAKQFLIPGARGDVRDRATTTAIAMLLWTLDGRWTQTLASARNANGEIPLRLLWEVA